MTVQNQKWLRKTVYYNWFWSPDLLPTYIPELHQLTNSFAFHKNIFHCSCNCIYLSKCAIWNRLSDIKCVSDNYVISHDCDLIHEPLWPWGFFLWHIICQFSSWSVQHIYCTWEQFRNLLTIVFFSYLLPLFLLIDFFLNKNFLVSQKSLLKFCRQRLHFSVSSRFTFVPFIPVLILLYIYIME